MKMNELWVSPEEMADLQAWMPSQQQADDLFKESPNMRLNLLLNNPADVRSGYINVDPLAPAGATDRVRCPLQDLTQVVDANEAAELVAKDVLDAFPATEIDQVLSHWLSRLAHGGTLTVSMLDLKEVARVYLANVITLDQANSLFYGEPGHRRQCGLTLLQLVTALEGKGMKVLSKRISECRAVVTAQRP